MPTNSASRQTTRKKFSILCSACKEFILVSDIVERHGLCSNCNRKLTLSQEQLSKLKEYTAIMNEIEQKGQRPKSQFSMAAALLVNLLLILVGWIGTSFLDLHSIRDWTQKRVAMTPLVLGLLFLVTVLAAGVALFNKHKSTKAKALLSCSECKQCRLIIPGQHSNGDKCILCGNPLSHI